MAGTEIASIWRDAPYLVVRDRVSKLPARCILCGTDQDCEQLSCRVRTRTGPWAGGIFSRAISLTPFVCATHRRPEINARRVGHVLLAAGLAMIIGGIGLVMKDPTATDVWLVPLSTGPMLVWGWMFYRLHRGRLLYANYIKDRVGWIENVHESILRAAPPLPP